MTTETLTLPNMVLPIGPVWATAAREVNWLAYRLVPRAGKKPAKLPVDKAGRPCDRAQAAVLSFHDACVRARALGDGYGIGYLARAGSAMVVLDLDGVVEPETLAWREDVLPGMKDYITGESYTELSPSGTGLHVLLPREGWPEATIDNGLDPVGLHGSGALFCALTLDAVQDVGPVAPAPRLQAAVLPALLQRLAERGEGENPLSKSYVVRGWFDELDADDQLELVVEVLEALPPAWVVDRERWRDVTFALRGYPGLWPAWDAWSQGGGSKYDAAENELLWWGRERGENVIGIGSFLMWGEEHGVDLRRRAQSGAVNRAEGALARVAERLERIAPGAMAEVRETAQEAEEVREGAIRSLVLYTPSVGERSERWFDLRRASTLSGVLSDMMPRQAVDMHFGPRTSANLRADPACMRTAIMPVRDPRKPFGFVPTPGDVFGTFPMGVVNALSMREVDARASTDPNHPALALWRELLAQVFPVEGERAWLEQWVANKVRRPWDRMVGVLSVAREHGTGRGVFQSVLTGLFGQDNVARLKVEDMFGATAPWNDWMTKLMVFVGEASDEESAGIARFTSHRRKAYEQLKDMIDPGEMLVRINVKGGKIGQVESFSSFFICTNHEDGLPIPYGDRRIAVLEGNETRASDAWYRRMRGGLHGNEEALAVIWRHLHEVVDMTGFRSDLAPETNAKALVVEAGRFPLDDELEGMLETLGWPLMVSGPLLQKLAVGRSELARSMHRAEKLGPAVERWMRSNSRSLVGEDAKGSRRVRFKGEQHRIRVLRKGEEGLSRSTVNAMLNVEVIEWLEALERDSTIVDLTQASSCRAMRKGLRVVR